MGFLGNLKARGAFLTHTKAIRANDTRNYAEAIKLEEAAIGKYEAALQQGMNKPSFLMAYSVLLMRLGQYERAMEIIRMTEKLDKLNTEDRRRLTMNYAICQWKLGDLDRAIGSMKELMKNYKNSTVYGSLGYMLIEQGDQTGDYEEARRFNAEALAYDDEDPVVLDNVAQYYYRTGDTAKAREYFEKALEERPTQVDSMYYLAKLKEQAGDLEGAGALMDEARKIHFSALSTVGKQRIDEYAAQLDATRGK